AGWPPGPGPPRSGAWLRPRRLVACGAQRVREAAAALHPEAGMAPVTDRRGTKAWGPRRLQGPTGLRHAGVAPAAATTSYRFLCNSIAPFSRKKVYGGECHLVQQ